MRYELVFQIAIDNRSEMVRLWTNDSAWSFLLFSWTFPNQQTPHLRYPFMDNMAPSRLRAGHGLEPAHSQDLVFWAQMLRRPPLDWI